MRTILTIVLGTLIAQTLRAQNDSLIIKLDDYGQLLIVNSNLVTKKSENLELDKTYKVFYTLFKKSIGKRILENEGCLIEFLNHRPFFNMPSSIKITKKNKEADKYYFYRKKVGSILDYRYKVTLSPQNILFLDSLNDFEKVANISLDSLYKQSKKNISPDTLNKRQAYLFFFNSNNGKLNEQSRFIYLDGKAQDFINLYSNFGAQIISSTLAPQIDLNLDLVFTKKNMIPGQKFGISSTFLFIPDKDDFHNINTYNFANVSYYLKLYKKWSQKISIGHLYAKNGNHFSSNTWNAFWESKIKKIGVKIGGYYTKNTKGKYVVTPSLGLSVDFGI